MLMDNEHSKMGEYENEYRQVLAEWKSSLPQRKAVDSHGIHADPPICSI